MPGKFLQTLPCLPLPNPTITEKLPSRGGRPTSLADKQKWELAD